MTEQSQFQKVPKKLLMKILVELDMGGEFDFDNPYDAGLYEDNERILIRTVKKYGFSPITDLDVQFFAQLKYMNKDILQIWYQDRDKEIGESLVIPVCHKWKVDYRVRGSEYFVDYFIDEFDCYRKDWVHDYVNELNNQGNWGYWDGKLLERDVRDSDTDGYEIDDVTAVDEEPKDGLLENYIKTRIEGTKNIINKLDRKTLLELRKMIDKKLGL